MMPQFISPNLGHIATQSQKPGIYNALAYGLYSLAIYRYLVAGFCLLLTSQLLLAETVQRWQDAQGQWHFGDPAAANGHNSQPVLITAPISIIKNDQPANASIITTPTQPKQSGKTERKQIVRKPASAPKDHCDTLRQQLNDRTSQRKKAQSYQVLAQRYDRECVAGHYYGN